MNIISDKQNLCERNKLNFSDAVIRNFSYLREFGFNVVELLPTLVRYQNGDIEVAVFHGRQSFEIGVDVFRRGVKYALSELMRIADPAAEADYRPFAATTPQGISDGLKYVAQLFRRFSERSLKGDAAYFAELDRQRSQWAKDYAMDVLADQLRPKADAAFRSGDYRQAAALYESIKSRLSDVEFKKLALAKSRAEHNAV